ncbi:MAG TPA: hypothetical protein VKU19_17110 [Bryobacteraceae bacterium]|nr:hypothetical protein [Bryobacteraceae bacterium]
MAKGKIIAKKVAEMKAYMDGVSSLIRRYVPPDPKDMQASFQSGKAKLIPAAGQLIFTDFAKPGDQVTLTFDPATKKLLSFVVTTYLDDKKDVVSLNASFNTLPDGTNFVETTILDATAKEIQAKLLIPSITSSVAEATVTGVPLRISVILLRQPVAEPAGSGVQATLTARPGRCREMGKPGWGKALVTAGFTALPDSLPQIAPGWSCTTCGTRLRPGRLSAGWNCRS